MCQVGRENSCNLVLHQFSGSSALYARRRDAAGGADRGIRAITIVRIPPVRNQLLAYEVAPRINQPLLMLALHHPLCILVLRVSCGPHTVTQAPNTRSFCTPAAVNPHCSFLFVTTALISSSNNFPYLSPLSWLLETRTVPNRT